MRDGGRIETNEEKDRHEGEGDKGAKEGERNRTGEGRDVLESDGRGGREA